MFDDVSALTLARFQFVFTVFAQLPCNWCIK